MVRLRAGNRTVVLVAAVVLAAVATYVLTAYVRGTEERAFSEAELVDVFVAQEEIPAGLSAEAAGEAGLIRRGTVPNRNLPDAAIASLDQIAGLVTAHPIVRNEVLVLGRWVEPSETDAAAIEIPEGFEALSVQVGAPPGVAGFIRGGDRISIIATAPVPSGVAQGPIVPPETDTPPGEGDDVAADTPTPGSLRTEYLLHGVQVLSVGQRASGDQSDVGTQDPGDQVLLTVAVEPQDAERLVAAVENASLYLTLLPDDPEPVDTPGRTTDDLFE